MPVHKIQGGYQYGNTGKKYYGKDAKKKAKLQELAIRLSGYKEDDEKKKRRYLKHEADYESIGRKFVSDFFNDDQLQHHGVLGQKWGIRRYQPYQKGYHGDGKYTGKLTRDQKLSKKNIKNAETANLEKFGKDREHNALYIAGYSGSGKSTMASGIAKKNDKIIRLDFYADPVNSETRGLRDKEFNRFLDKKGIDYKRVANAHKREKHTFYQTGSYWKEVDAIREAITEYSKEQFDKGNRVIVEGVQIPGDWLAGEKSYYKGKPMIIMRTPILTSIHRGSRRDGITGLKEIKHAKEVYAYFKRSNKRLDDLAKETGAIKNGKEFVDLIIKGGQP